MEFATRKYGFEETVPVVALPDFLTASTSGFPGNVAWA
jgi:hypothetical protein